MSEDLVFPVADEVANRAWADNDKYLEMYKQSVDDPEGFWGEEGKRIDWIKPYTKIKNTTYDKPVSIKWYEDGTLNASANCLDRHLAKRGDQTAIIWEGDDPADSKTITYRELHREVCKLANALKGLG
ncbi:MAG: acetyl-coenzyme A synthetase, partial [Rhodospirillales bacterium]|nr:acetyl-coenzyme A synthetase [Rhodospirillales bacterium]